jgi:hypothetical protein
MNEDYLARVEATSIDPPELTDISSPWRAPFPDWADDIVSRVEEALAARRVPAWMHLVPALRVEVRGVLADIIREDAIAYLSDRV